jgi:hypothetical protein
MGLYDFTDNQWHNQLRTRRIVIRGSAGEIANDEVVRLIGPRTIVRSPLVRRQTGYDLDLDGFDTDHISLGDTILYRNPFPGLRLSDEEIAIGGCSRRWPPGARRGRPAVSARRRLPGSPDRAGDRGVRLERDAGHHGRGSVGCRRSRRAAAPRAGRR